MKPGKNVRRQILRDSLGDPVRDKDGSIVTWATPRGKAYPYSSDRQKARDKCKAERIEMREALDWMVEEIHQSLGMRVA